MDEYDWAKVICPHHRSKIPADQMESSTRMIAVVLDFAAVLRNQKTSEVTLYPSNLAQVRFFGWEALEQSLVAAVPPRVLKGMVWTFRG